MTTFGSNRDCDSDDPSKQVEKATNLVTALSKLLTAVLNLFQKRK